MKTKEQLQKEIDELGAVVGDMYQKIIALQHPLSAQPDEAKKEWPQDGDKYELIHAEGTLSLSQWDGDNTDKARKEFGNVFRPGTGAKECAYLKFERAVRAKATELNDGWVADWDDSNQVKHMVEIDLRNSHAYAQNYSSIYGGLVRGSECKSREAAQALLDHFGADKFLAYATGGDL